MLTDEASTQPYTQTHKLKEVQEGIVKATLFKPSSPSTLNVRIAVHASMLGPNPLTSCNCWGYSGRGGC